MNKSGKAEHKPMKISEYIKAERDKIKGKSWKERLAYFWDYYKWYVLIAVVALALLTHTVTTSLNKKEVVLKGILIDGIGTVEEPAVLQTFFDSAGINPEKQEVYLNTGLALNSGIPSIVTTLLMIPAMFLQIFGIFSALKFLRSRKNICITLMQL